MARAPTTRQLYEELLTRHGRDIADAFQRAVNNLATEADLARLTAALEAGNIPAAIAALNLDDAVYEPVLEAVRAAYASGGQTAVERFPVSRGRDGTSLVVRFSIRNPRAEQWLAERSSTLVREIVDDQRLAVRQALVAGMARGENPRTTALSIVGRMNAQGRREGGILGLTSIQEDYTRTARTELASGDPEQMRNYLSRARRDKRFDRAVMRAIEEEQPLPAETIGRAVTRYKSRLLQLRGETIGRTEGLTALRAARREAYLQAVESGAVAESDVRRTWRDAGDGRVRHSHVVLDGQTVGLNEAYRSPTGARLMYPGDPKAPARERIGCRCDEDYRIDFLANLR